MNLNNNRGIKFYNAWIINDNVTANNITVTNPEGDSTKNYARNWGGFMRIITVGFTLFNDTTDKSVSGSEGIVTLSEQRNYMTESGGIVQSKSGGANIADVSYQVTVYEDGTTVGKTYTGAIEDVSIAAQSSESTLLRGTLNIYESRPDS